ncbi:MAG: hypothetical protein DCC59_00600 [Chloroflexi bacterium]|nr:3-oxo-5-alpha-steroid 4-dehydrogenase [Anaerolineales bacterium]RIK55486.1 MAG: hypothetical protein DCC59_00600 [Chloroflexota bacterium]
MILTEWTTFNIIHHVVLAALVITVGPVVYFGQSNSNYNKPRAGNGLPARLGMFILYATPLLALFLSAKDYLPSASAIQRIVFAAVFVHFSKRTLESLFLHKYSRATSLVNTLVIGFFYSQAAFTVGWLNRNPVPAVDPLFIVGIILFLTGISGNYYYHKLLAGLRKESSAGYFIPKGGLFRYVVCPHYLFEIVGWAGIALLSRHSTTWLNLLAMTSFLVGQGLRALSWYRATFKDFPKDKKAILPFIL